MDSINLYKNVKNPTTDKTITINEYISLIKDGHKTESIQAARLQTKHSSIYKKAKEERSCVTFNFLFNGRKRDSNIISSTGLVYFDIDREIVLSTLDQSKIFIHHKSFGGTGSCIIVRTNGITPENFKDSYIYIADQLGIKDLIDANAVKKTQYTILSYDPNLFYNEHSFVFDATEKVSFVSKLGVVERILPTNDTFLKRPYTGTKTRITNASDYVGEGDDYKVFPDGIKVAKIDIPRSIPNGSRNRVLIAVVSQNASLNPHLTYDQLSYSAIGLNAYCCKEPLAFNEVKGIVDSIWKYKEQGTLKPILNHTRKIIFNETCKLTKEEKADIRNKKIGELKSNNTKKRIYEAIEGWNRDEKITAKKIASELKAGIATVKRYWPEFKEAVDIFNKRFKEDVQVGRVNVKEEKDNAAIALKTGLEGDCTSLPPSDAVDTHEISLSEFCQMVVSLATREYSRDTITRYYYSMKELGIPINTQSIKSVFIIDN